MIKLKATWVHCDVDIMKYVDDWRLQKFHFCCFLQTVYRDINIDGIQIQAVWYWQISVLHPIWMPMLEFRIRNCLGGQKFNINHHSYQWLSWKPLLFLSCFIHSQNEFARQRDPFNHLNLIKNMQKSFPVTSSISS